MKLTSIKLENYQVVILTLCNCESLQVQDDSRPLHVLHLHEISSDYILVYRDRCLYSYPIQNINDCKPVLETTVAHFQNHNILTS